MVTGLGFATVGVRGATDGLAVDLLLGSFEHACGGIGGFCAGRQDLVDVQRLFGTGYCFSASAPVYAMACAGTEGARTQRGMDADTITSHRIAVPSVP